MLAVLCLKLDMHTAFGYYSCVDQQIAAINQEMTRAERLLHSLKGSTIDTVSINSLGAEDAPFLGLVVSKLSPIIGNLLEHKIIGLIGRGSKHGLIWQRQDPDFPDIVLIDRKGKSTRTGYEVKAWYALSTELTGRFRESRNLLNNRNVRVVIVAWIMSHIVYGSPLILDVLSVDAASIAARRDEHYHKPPLYLTVEPQDTSLRTRNLQQTNVNGYRMQENDPLRLAEAQKLVDGHPGRIANPHTQEAQALNMELMNRFTYRLDTNFAKVDRIDHPDIERFKVSVLGSVEQGRRVTQWAGILRALNDDSRPSAKAQAIEVIKTVYDNTS